MIVIENKKSIAQNTRSPDSTPFNGEQSPNSSMRRSDVRLFNQSRFMDQQEGSAVNTPVGKSIIPLQIQVDSDNEFDEIP